MANNLTTVDNNFITGLVKHVQKRQELGMEFPNDYNPVNELNAAYFILKETVDRNKNPVLQSCTPESIATALMTMVNNGLSMINGQCYPVAYAGKLQCQTSVYGNTCNARRYGMKDINATPIYEGDEFIYHIEDGKKVIDSHKTDFKNIDNSKIIGAYAVAIMSDGTKKCEIMTMAQIKMAWKQGFGYRENGDGTHQKFTDQMCEKTVKNRLLKQIIKTHGKPMSLTNVDEEEETVSHTEMIEKDAEYEIKENANKTEFEFEDVAEENVISEDEVEIEVIEPNFEVEE